MGIDAAKQWVSIKRGVAEILGRFGFKSTDWWLVLRVIPLQAIAYPRSFLCNPPPSKATTDPIPSLSTKLSVRCSLGLPPASCSARCSPSDKATKLSPPCTTLTLRQPLKARRNWKNRWAKGFPSISTESFGWLKSENPCTAVTASCRNIMSLSGP